MNENGEKPVEPVVEPVEKVPLPRWVIKTLASAAFTVIIAVGGSYATVWKATSMHEAAISSLSEVVKGVVVQVGVMQTANAKLETKVERLEKEQSQFQALAIDKIDTLLERDRFRKNR